MNLNTYVIVLDDQDRPAGLCDKMEAHRKGLRHLAFSVFLLNDGNQMLLQKRHSGKYHSGGLWSNACCSHPTGNNLIKEATVRLKQEMGIRCDLTPLFTFCYRVEFENGMIENEMDTVLVGRYNGKVYPDPSEVEDHRWVDVSLLETEIEEHPKRYSFWFKESIGKVLGCLAQGIA